MWKIMLTFVTRKMSKNMANENNDYLKKLNESKKEMLEFINRIVKECGQVQLGPDFGKFRNLMWDDEDGVLLQTMSAPNGYIFPRLADKSYPIVKAIYTDLKKDFE